MNLMPTIKHLSVAMLRLLRPEVAGVFLVALLTCWVVGEQYPFSDFPMYSNFGKSTYVVYVTDENDEPIPVLREFGMRTSILKKVYHSEAKTVSKAVHKKMAELTVDELRPCGVYALEKMVNYHPYHTKRQENYSELRLYHQTIVRGPHGIVRESRLIATRPRP